MPTVNLDKVLKDLDANVAGRTDYKIFMCLAEHMNDEGVSAVPQSLLGKETGFKRRTVSNSVQRLAEKGFFTIERNMTEHGGIATNIYHLNPEYLTHAKPVEQAQTKTRVQETQKTTPGCVNLEKALLELGSNGVNGKAKKIFTLIARHANQNGEARLLMREITDATHISAKVVNNEIGFLIHNGFLTVSKEFVNTGTAHYYRNVYTIDSRFLGKRTPQDSACNEPCCPETSEVRVLHDDLTRLHDVLVDVVADILVAAVERNNK